ncbi:MAG: hypothetical protein AAB479_01065 [Patescibacteria group bacterium]
MPDASGDTTRETGHVSGVRNESSASKKEK